MYVCYRVDVPGNNEKEETGCHHGVTFPWNEPSSLPGSFAPCSGAPALCSDGVATVDMLLAMMSFMASECSEACSVSVREEMTPHFLPFALPLPLDSWLEFTA